MNAIFLNSRKHLFSGCAGLYSEL